MSYLVLARKYRPKSFADVAGQENVTRVLQGAISEDRIGHAYLFTGPRGTGKTTSARLFAKALNCETGPAQEPCGTCERCVALDSGGEVDVVEIDAASNTGVDHVRELRDQAAYVPLRARFKVYIIDEVHMLSKAAFNALLKTLEEPPPHVKFLFATTELRKVPDTVLSRCQVLHLSPLDESTISARLAEVFATEGVDAAPGVTQDLARRARGGMRDALSMADQLLALVGSSPTLEDCERLAGSGSASAVEAVVEALLAEDRPALLAALPAQEGDEASFLGALLDHLRACLLAALVGEGAPLLSGGDPAALAARGKRIGARRLELWLQELLAARERMRLLPSHSRLALEVTLLDLSRPDATLPLDELVKRLERLEARVGGNGGAGSGSGPGSGSGAGSAATISERVVSVAPAPAPARAPETASAEPSRPVPDASLPADTTQRPRVRTNSVADAWAGFLAELESASPSLHSVVDRRGRLERYAGGRATVKLAGLTDDERTLVSERRNQKTCTRAFTKAVGSEVEVHFEDAAQARPGADDPFTKEVADLFEGRIED